MKLSHSTYLKEKPWALTWRDHGTGSRHTLRFRSEDEALSFKRCQEELLRKEKALFRKKRLERAESRLTVSDLFRRYLLLSDHSPVTLRTTRYHVFSLLKLLGGHLVRRLSVDHVLAYSEAQKQRGLSQSTINRRIGILRAALHWAEDNGIIKASPLGRLRLPKARSVRIAPPTIAELKSILNAAAPHIRRIVIIGFSFGPRIGPSELFRLEWRDVDLDTAMLRMPSARKNAQMSVRDIPIRNSLLPIFRSWKVSDEKRGINHVISWGGHPIRSIERGWHNALKKAGISRRIRPYDLRHAFATYALAGGADIGSVANLMGHTDASMILKVYQHIMDSQKRAAMEALPDLAALCEESATE